jgi:hypothetical protein
MRSAVNESTLHVSLLTTVLPEVAGRQHALRVLLSSSTCNADIHTRNILLYDKYDYDVIKVDDNAHNKGRFFKNVHKQTTITSLLLVVVVLLAAALLRCFAA